MASGTRQLHVRMQGRNADEAHRGSSPLELLYDLTFVVAVSSVSARLADGVGSGEGLLTVIVPYLMVFFAIWWAWINFTWFASAYDTDDVVYRVATLVQMAGVLVIAAGVPAAAAHFDFTAITIGYVVMRVAAVGQWLRAGIEHPASRGTAFRYAAGVLVVQLGWIASLLFVPRSWSPAAFVILAAAELAVPVWAESRVRISWHPGHIAERYSLFVIILLGEGVAAATGAMQRALAVSGITPQLIAVGLSGLVVLFAIWWLYFLEPAARGLRERPRWSYFWGYGHYFLFAAIAAVGAGLEVAVERTGHEAHGGGVVAGYAVAIPVAAVFVLLYVLHRPLVDRPEVPARVLFPAAVATLVLPLAVPAFGVAAMVMALAALSALVVAVTLALRRD